MHINKVNNIMKVSLELLLVISVCVCVCVCVCTAHWLAKNLAFLYK